MKHIGRLFHASRVHTDHGWNGWIASCLSSCVQPCARCWTAVRTVATLAVGSRELKVVCGEHWESREFSEGTTPGYSVWFKFDAMCASPVKWRYSCCSPKVDIMKADLHTGPQASCPSEPSLRHTDHIQTIQIITGRVCTLLWSC